MNKSKILLFGTGPMACEYTKVLKAQGHDFIVIGRGENSAKAFQKKTNITPIAGGAKKFLSQSDYSNWKAIVAVTGDQLGKVALDLMKHGVKSILLEKPGGINAEEIQMIYDESQKYSANIFIAYNRRFYSSTNKAAEIINTDNGVLSFNFDFTELSNDVAKLKAPQAIKENWLLHNSSHVIDLAFFLGAVPVRMTSFVSGSLPWHPKAAVFCGAGITCQNALFAYHADWATPGRWSLEVMTKNHKLVFKPLEKLQIQNEGSFEIKEVQINNNLDIKFKPGLYKEVESFLSNKQNLCTISEQLKNTKFYQQILDGRI